MIAPTRDGRAATSGLHPVRFLLLILPFGLVYGFALVTLSFQLSQAGVGAGALGNLLALTYLPQTWKFLWAPLVDTRGTRRQWYVAGALGCALLGLLLPGVLVEWRPLPIAALGGAFVAGSFASTLVAMAVERAMATLVPDAQRGRVAGWYQAGNLGGMGLGGGLALWLIQTLHWAPVAAGGVLAALCLVGCAAMWWLPESVPGLHEAHDASPGSGESAPSAGFVRVLRDLWSLVRSRTGALAVLVCFLPIGAGAASNLWPAVAGQWQAGANVVALVDGVMAGVVSAAGCLAGGWFCDRMDRRTAYCASGLAQVAAALLMAMSPRTPAGFVAGTMVYAFVSGLTYAAFSALVLEAIGRSSAATKYNLLAALSNMPIAYMTLVDGHANDRWGAAGMLFAESGIATAAIALFMAIAGATRRRGPRPGAPVDAEPGTAPGVM